jgi:hypothetical protein
MYAAHCSQVSALSRRRHNCHWLNMPLNRIWPFSHAKPAIPLHRHLARQVQLLRSNRKLFRALSFSEH